jgi:hypothetical protein
MTRYGCSCSGWEESGVVQRPADQSNPIERGYLYWNTPWRSTLCPSCMAWLFMSGVKP